MEVHLRPFFFGQYDARHATFTLRGVYTTEFGLNSMTGI